MRDHSESGPSRQFKALPGVESNQPVEAAGEKPTTLPRPASRDGFDRQRHLRWVRGQEKIAREHRVTVAGVAAILGIVSLVVYDSVRVIFGKAIDGSYFASIGDLFVMGVAVLLAYGSVVYLLARDGHLKRLLARVVDDATVNDNERDDDSPLLVLIPSYREAPHIVRRTIISAALQPYARRRVVLLIDDSPDDPPGESLSLARALPAQIEEMLRPMREYCELALHRFDQRSRTAGFSLADESRRLADACCRVADGFDGLADNCFVTELDDRFFLDLTFRMPALRWRHSAQQWTELADDPHGAPSPDRLRRVYCRMLTTFRVEISSFERKQYPNLSHATNKAMNINSYLGLVGGSYRREPSGAGPLLSRCSVERAELVIPDAEFVLILDADTIISPDYTPKLMRRFHEPGGQRLAVVQSPYSTFPGERSLLQRIAGAQTDIQYLVHQGLTHYKATYWVGANALVRVAALRDVATQDLERGFEVVKFVSDRTLIEDTESSIDLMSKGWGLFNQAERLAFSMTPPDFGSLLIQRRRWASGGLLIVPKLLNHLRQPGKISDRLKEGFMRFQYLISLGPVSMALLVALGVSFDNQVRTSLLAGIGLVYYLVYARDLHLIGYRWHDIFRVFALNLLLIPINLMGMMLSIRQAITGRKAVFTRTPKVHDRTRIAPRYLWAEFVLLAIWCAQIGWTFFAARHLAGLMLIHIIFLMYAIGAFIGYRNALSDLTASWTPGDEKN